ncbi:MAG: hypothetical protein LBS21_16040, partial [Clostridiales bacterium]|nr:hypothetical protein [Clostridiales bacterium]
ESQALQQILTDKFRQISGDYTLKDALEQYHILNPDIDKEAYTMDALEAAVLLGRDEGRAEGKVLMCSEFGLDEKDIAKKVGISVDEVRRIILESAIAS